MTTMLSVLTGLANSLTDLVLAPVCLGCDGAIAAGDTARLVCRRCRTLLRAVPQPACNRCGAPILRTGRERRDRESVAHEAGDTPTSACPECAHLPPQVSYARSACLLYPPADRLVHELKYRGWHALAGPMAERMTVVDVPGHASAAPALPRVCIPVPTTAARLRTRGYNQAAELARNYARLTGLEMVDCLARTGSRGTQTTLQPAARAANVAGAFALKEGAHGDVRGAHVLLVDDVLTTGATAAECALTLAAAGACCVSILTFARALDARRLIQT